MFQHSKPTASASTSFQVPDQVWKMLWGLPVPPKLKHFWWRCCHNSLATKQNLFRCKSSREDVCPICLAESESIKHLICGCAWTKVVWFGSDLSLTFKDEVTSISRWMCNLYSAFSNSKERRYFFSKLLWVGWHIWKSRNALVFNRLPVDPQSTIYQAARDNLEFLLVAPRHSFEGSPNHTPVDAANVVWTALSSGCFKANCDVAMEKGSTKTSIVVLFRNWKGELVDGAVQRIEMQSVLQGEAFAVRKACLMARALNLSQVEI